MAREDFCTDFYFFYQTSFKLLSFELIEYIFKGEIELLLLYNFKVIGQGDGVFYKQKNWEPCTFRTAVIECKTCTKYVL